MNRVGVEAEALDYSGYQAYISWALEKLKHGIPTFPINRKHSRITSTAKYFTANIASAEIAQRGGSTGDKIATIICTLFLSHPTIHNLLYLSSQ